MKCMTIMSLSTSKLSYVGIVNIRSWLEAERDFFLLFSSNVMYNIFYRFPIQICLKHYRDGCSLMEMFANEVMLLLDFVIVCIGNMI